MAVSAFQKVLNRLFRQFALRNGREPQTPKEWMDLQNEAVQYFNLTKGKGVTGSVRTSGGDVRPIADPTIGFKPKVIQGGKGIESLLKSGDVKKGVAPKTTKETLKAKKDKHILLRDSEEGIARIKRENKQAIEDFKKKHGKKTVEDFRDEGDWDPSGMASGGRIAMAGGGALFKFIQGLFIKASNDIRLGRGKWKGLDQKQRIIQHDNLTKKITEFQKSGNTEGLEIYFDVNPHEAFAKAEKKALLKKYQAENPNITLSYGDKDKRLIPEGTTEESIDEAIRRGNAERAEKEALKQKYPGLTDDLLEMILIDNNPQRKAEVQATLDQYLKLKEVGKTEAEAYDIITQSFKKDRLPNQSGGPVNMEALIQMYMDEGLSPEDAAEAAQAAQNLPWNTLTKAEGGRIGMAGGGIAKGARWFINSLKKNLNDMEAGHPRFKVIPAEEQETLKVGYRTLIKDLEAGGEVPVEALEAISKNPQYYKTKKVVRSQDPDLAEVEELIDEKVFGDVRQELKDFEVVGRKPQASGGLAYMLGEPNTRTEALQEFGVVTDPWGMYTDPSLYAQGERSTGTPGRTEYSRGGVGHPPITFPTPKPPQPQQLDTPQPQGIGQPNPMHMPRGIPSAAPRSMDPQYQQQQRMQQMMAQQMSQQPRMGMKDGGTWKEPTKRDIVEQIILSQKYPDREAALPHDKALDVLKEGIGLYFLGGPKYGFSKIFGDTVGKAIGKRQHRRQKEGRLAHAMDEADERFQDTGDYDERAGFAGGGMTRRMFLKLMAGLASLPLIGKGVQKAAPKVIPKAAEVIARDVDGIPKYAFDLIEVVKARGTKEIMEGIYKRNPPATKYNYKGVEVTEDGLGNTSVRKEMEETKSWNDEINDDVIVEDVVDREVGFEIKKGGDIVKDEGLETQKAIKGSDEYTESTAYMEGDYDGGIDVSDIVEVIDDADHLDLKKIADEIKDIRPKKASGGIVKLLKKVAKKIKTMKKPEDYVMDQGHKLGKYYQKHPEKGADVAAAIGAGVLIDRHLKRKKKASGGLAYMLGE